ncbi:transcription-repair coupling factor [Ferruginivarius sediminum]|uniref:Transcription-repair-coupling factor n=1 Tax=Ferruginivarius sediminum TaxID=2661937 RepID=A0A369TFE0_9PROT|nr:transcription-repair coupling factor [Ferruginivarius sediminum]RDD63970.1 transcription-repair coupling factor [Ferruginivarius sediminum]
MTRTAEALAFFAPECRVLTFPAWDCLPYDRVSPHRDIVAERVDTLTRLMTEPAHPGGLVVLTTVNALLQRLPPAEALRPRMLTAKAGEQIAPEKLTAFFAENGYVRSDTVGEAGEYAIRGGIVDVFPPGEPEPLRLDFFGDELETVRTFDPLSQRTTGKHEGLTLKPVNEVILQEDTIHRFRTRYRETFGTPPKDDPLYAAVSEGRPHPGMEHWLPLFYERLETLLDYLPADAPVTLDRQAEEARDQRLETIRDFFEARQTVQHGNELDTWSYKPLQPELLYQTAADWDAALDPRPVASFSPFAAPGDAGYVVDAGGRPGHDFAAARKKGDEGEPYMSLRTTIREEQEAGRRVAIAGYTQGSRERLKSVLADHGLERLALADSWAEAQALEPKSVALVTLALEHGFTSESAAIISEQDILGERIARPARRKRRAENFLTEVSSLYEGDLVVHVEHGVGRYEGLETLDVGGAAHDMLRVTYAGNDRLFVPVENLEVLSRFGSEEAGVHLDRLGQGNWQARKAKVKERVKEIADRLIRVAAQRQVKTLDPMEVPAGSFEEFCARFPYPETDDQLRAIEDTLADMASGKPMDRLICGDVGFGKTEVALRAAFVAAMSGKQVAVIVPTTLLARQHYQTLVQRFSGYPVVIRQLSRLVGTKDTADIKRDLKDGKVDIVVGTHTLLGQNVEFRELGLIIVDEEQHFGVKQKEKLKALRGDLHVLTLTATPIPRTLQLALSGVREMSIISTPPVDRLAVRTFVLPFDPVVVREAVLREHWRGGQTFYVCPRIEDLNEVEERLTKLVPEVKLAVAHGRVGARELENVMTDFYEGKYDVLLSTHIVESGLDIPTANTLIIHRADMFGLAQLYQLRGRIGRSKVRGYAYLTLRAGQRLTDAAEKRLHVMQTLDHLGAGFSLASHDLDIRGAGNLVGEEQSGHIREVGIELYQQMLEEAVAEARGGGPEEKEAAEAFTPQINIGTSVLIPERYVADLNVRLGLYRRIAHLVDRQEIEGFAAELIDRFGPLPQEVENLLQTVAIKQLCRDANVEKVEAGPKGAVLQFHNDTFPDPQGLVRFIGQQVGKVQLRPDHKLVYRRRWDEPQDRVQGIRGLLDKLSKVARGAEAA